MQTLLSLVTIFVSWKERSREEAGRSLSEKSLQASTLGSVSYQGHKKMTSERIALMGTGEGKKAVSSPWSESPKGPYAR